LWREPNQATASAPLVNLNAELTLHEAIARPRLPRLQIGLHSQCVRDQQNVEAMTIFAVFRVSNPAKMETAIRSAYPNDHLKIDTDEWLVSDKGTAVEVSHKLGITSPTDASTVNGPAIVFSMANYYGRASTEIWDWIKTKLEAPSG
jgi:hypothetical protein